MQPNTPVNNTALRIEPSAGTYNLHRNNDIKQTSWRRCRGVCAFINYARKPKGAPAAHMPPQQRFYRNHKRFLCRRTAPLDRRWFQERAQQPFALAIFRYSRGAYPVFSLKHFPKWLT